MPDISSLTDEINRLTQSISGWNSAIVVLMVLAAAAATGLVVAQRVAFKKSEKLATLTDQRSGLEKAVSDGKIAALGVEAANAQERAAHASERAASLEVEAAVLRKQISGQERRANVLMDPTIRSQVINDLEPFAGQYFDTVSCGMKESEIAYFSMAVWSTLEAAKWSVGKIENNSPSCTAGLIILVNSSASKSTRDAAQSLLKALIKHRLAPETSTVVNLPNPWDQQPPSGTWWLQSSREESIVILVGTHP